LSINERKRILTSHIYGVDIDTQAVEVTKLSLLLKALEGLNEQEIQKELFNERVLPDLSRHRKCGHSLIGTDFYIQGTLGLSEDDQYRINVFDWETEFADVFRDGGFDAVIGNPPWGADIDDYTHYFEEKYPNSTQSYKDSFKIFIEKAYSLAKEGSLFSFIVPSVFMLQPRYIDVRRFLRDNTTIHRLWNIGDGVFGPHVVAPCAIFIVEKVKAKEDHVVLFMDTTNLKTDEQRVDAAQNAVYRKIGQNVYKKTAEETFISFYRELKANEVFLKEILDCKDCGIKQQRVGVGLSEKGKSDLTERLFYEGKKQNNIDKKYLIGADLDKNGWFIDESHERYFRGDYKKILKKNEIVYFNETIFNLEEKIVWRQTSDRIRANILGKGWFANTLQAGILKNPSYNIRYILGLLNSRFINFIYLETVKEGGRVFPQVKMGKLRLLPFRTINFSKKPDKAHHDKLVGLVDQMLALKKKERAETVPQTKTMLGRQIQAVDKQIDALVYELYGLTEEEIRVVEGEV
jgi:hypothetical protein